MKLGKHLSEINRELTSFMNNSYPEFVTAVKPGDRGDEIPVFVFHSIEQDIFQSQLEYLHANGYHTVDADEFYAHIQGVVPIKPRTVLLAVDDGRKSFWEQGYPLLQKYGYKAVVFIIPGYTPENSSIKINPKPAKGEELVSWEEIQIMHESGLVDFQSHTLYHHKLFTGRRIVDFLTEESVQALYNQDVPVDMEEDITSSTIRDYYGLPLYESSSLMEARRLYVDDHDLRKRCIEFYQNASSDGGVKQGKKAMFDFVKEYTKERKYSDYYLSSEEMEQTILQNLTTSKETIEKRLNKEVRHLCYPYSLYSETSTELSREAGYRTNFCGCIPNIKVNKKGGDPFRCVRLKDDFIFRLPGAGRKSLRDIIMFKFKRRSSGAPVY